MTRSEFIETLNTWGASKTPFLFIVDFEFNQPVAIPLNEAHHHQLLFNINGFTNGQATFNRTQTIALLDKKPLSFNNYKNKFDRVYKHLSYGDTYLANLTAKTELTINVSLEDIFYQSRANYKLLYGNQFLVFSPETFIKIYAGKIWSYPMKGTIDAATADAAHKILSDKKELAEHVTIVDLIRNDLSQVASNVMVTRFRYLDEIKTDTKNLLQVSSEISGELPSGYHASLGSILAALLPAGSVSGAPKPKTLEVLKEAEQEDRGYYTGVFGYFNGTDLDSAVMIRYIEQKNGEHFYRSGGGITTQSEAMQEYQELLDKVYIPI